MVEPDLASLQPPGVTNHTFRFPFPELPASPERLLALMEPAIVMVGACEPDHLVLGYSPEYMPQAAAVARQLKASLEQATGVAVSTATEAVSAALRALNCKRLGIVNPFPEQPFVPWTTAALIAYCKWAQTCWLPRWWSSWSWRWANQWLLSTPPLTGTPCDN